MSKLDGQIWIESNAPYKLKYHRAGKDFAVETSEEYTIPSNADIDVGDLVKIDSNGALVKAVFPDDLRNVIGMLVSSTGAVSKTGYVNIPLDKIEDRENIFKGDNIYWLDSDKYNHNIVKNSNVKYHNLPLIGTVVGISDNIASIHLNIDSFDTTIEWSVFIDKVNPEDEVEATTKYEAIDIAEDFITVHHELPAASLSKTSIEIDNSIALAASTEGTGTTTFYIKTIKDKESYSYKLSGSMIYG